jgi:hypothetical protein
MRFAKELGGDPFSYGAHLDGEPRTFTIAAKFGPGSLFAIALLLRDRYFPTTWIMDR